MHVGMALHLLWVPWDICELYLFIWVEECWQEGAQSWREEGNKLDTAGQMSGATALLCPWSPWINKAFIHIFSHSMYAEHLHGSCSPHTKHPRSREQHQHWVHRPQQESTQKELWESSPKTWDTPRGAPWCHGHQKPSLPRKLHPQRSDLPLRADLPGIHWSPRSLKPWGLLCWRLPGVWAARAGAANSPEHPPLSPAWINHILQTKHQI